MSLGIIGCGRQGRKVAIEVLDKLGEAARIAAVCDPVERLATSLQGRAKGSVTFTSHRELLEKGGVDAVVIATPTHTHREIALDCIGAGKHVYCEVPLAHTNEDCVAIAKAAREAGGGKVLAGACEGRSNPIYQLARSFFKTDAVRDVVSMYAQDHRKSTWGRAGDWWLDPAVSTGLAGESGVQQFDVMHWFRGAYPVEVSGRGSIRLHEDGRKVADTVRATLRWADETELNYSATLCNSFGGKHETFMAVNAAMKLAWSHGWMFKEADAPQLGFEVYANRQQFHNDEGITLIADATKLASQGKLKEGVGLPHSSAYYGVNDFLGAVIEGREAKCSVSEAARASMVALAVNEAVKTGKSVAIDGEMLKGV